LYLFILSFEFVCVIDIFVMAKKKNALHKLMQELSLETPKGRKKRNRGNRQVMAKARNFVNLVGNPKVPRVMSRGGGVQNVAARGKRMEAMEHVCSLVDPWCPEAKGMRLPDGNANPTIPWQSRFNFQVQTNGSGSASFLFIPVLSGYQSTQTTSQTGNTIVSTATRTDSSAISTFMTTYAQKTRLVSAGFKWVPTLASTVASAPVFLTTIADGTNLIANGTTSIAVNAMDGIGQKVDVFDARETISFISLPLDKNSMMFQNVSSTVIAGFTSALFTIYGGAASTTYGYIDCCLNWEVELIGMSNANNIYTSIASKSADLPAVLIARGKVAETMDNVVHGDEQVLSTKVKSYVGGAVDELIATGAGTVATYFGGPAAGAATYGAVGSMSNRFRKRFDLLQ